MLLLLLFSFFFFNDTPTTEIYTLSLHDALPISYSRCHSDAERAERSAIMPRPGERHGIGFLFRPRFPRSSIDRKSTRLNSSHSSISYAVFCLKKKKNKQRTTNTTY